MLVRTGESVELVAENRDLRCVDIERLVLAGAALRILRRHGVAHDSGRRIIGNDPLRDPELPLGLLIGLAITHRDINGFAVKRQMNNELRCAIPLARGRIDGRHSEAYRLATFELSARRAGTWLAQAKEVHYVSVHHYTIATT